VLFTFPSRYCSTIGRQWVFSLGRWSSRIHTGFLVPRATWVRAQARNIPFGYGAITLCGAAFQPSSPRNVPSPRSAAALRTNTSRNPHTTTPAGLALHGFGLFPVRSPLLGKSLLFSFPPGTKMFQFPGYGLLTLCVHVRMTRHDSRRVAPFGYPRFKACLRLTEDYRSSLRPSSPSGA